MIPAFLSPYILYALILAGIPILIHLISVKKAKILKFPEIRFVRLAVNRTMKKIKLLQLLLLLLRILAIILIVLAFARAVLNPPKSNANKKEEPAAAVFLLDCSYSMGAESAGKAGFEQARESCLESLKVFGADDRVAFCAFTDNVTDGLGLEFDREKLSAKIKGAKLSGRNTSLKAALNFAYTALKESNSKNKQIIIFTDAAKHGLNIASPAEIKDIDPDVKVVIACAGTPGGNRGIISAEPAVSMPGRAGFNITSSDFSGEGVKAADVSVYSGGERKVFGKADIAAGGTSVKTLFFPDPDGKGTEGYAEVSSGDCLAYDDKYYFARASKKKKNVLLIDGDPKLSQFNSETFFIRTALAPEVSKDPDIVPVVLAPSALATSDLSKYNVIFICNVESISVEAERRLDSFIRSGGSLVYFPGDRVDVKAYASMDRSVFPAVMKKLLKEEDIVNPLSFSRDSALFKNFDAFGLIKANFYGHMDLSPVPGAEVLLSFKDGMPFLIEGRSAVPGTGKALVFAVPADRDLSDLPLKPVYLPFVKALVWYLAGTDDLSGTYEIKCGEVFKREPRGDMIKSASFTGPDGLQRKAEVRDGKVFVKDTDEPGLYKLSIAEAGGRGFFEFFAVNVDAKGGESVLARFSAEDLKQAIKAKRVELIKCSPGIAGELTLIVRGREISSMLLLAALIILAVESVAAMGRL